MTREPKKRRFDEVETLLTLGLVDLGFSHIGDRGTQLDPNYFGLEFIFNPLRRWRFDAACRGVVGPDPIKIAIEVEGGAWMRSGTAAHTSPTSYLKDMEKYNEATILGWRILRFTPEQVRDGSWLSTVKRALGRG
jgi:hypothetical protein